MNKRVIELINRDIDGCTSPAEHDELGTQLRLDPEARRLFDDLKSLAGTMSDVQPVEPPATLKASVMRAIEAGPSPKRKRIALWLPAAFAVRGSVRPGFAFAGGIAAGILLCVMYIAIAARSGVEPSDASATMIMHPSSRTIEKGDVVTFDLQQGHGAITTGYSDDIRILTVQLASATEMTAHIAYKAGKLNLEGIRRGDVPGGALTVHPGDIEVVSSGSESYSIYFTKKEDVPPAVQLTLTSGNAVVFEQSISLEHQDR